MVWMTDEAKIMLDTVLVVCTLNWRHQFVVVVYTCSLLAGGFHAFLGSFIFLAARFIMSECVLYRVLGIEGSWCVGFCKKKGSVGKADPAALVAYASWMGQFYRWIDTLILQ